MAVQVENGYGFISGECLTDGHVRRQPLECELILVGLLHVET